METESPWSHAIRAIFGQSWFGAGLVVAAGVAVYANSFAGAFQFDDIPAIRENPTLRHPGQLIAVLAPPGEQAGTVGGRPMVNLSLALNHGLGGERTWGYHAFNLIVHTLAALLLYGIVRRTLRSSRRWTTTETEGMSFFAALLWAVHPLQTEAVTYVVQRAESLMGFFYFSTLYCFIRYSEAVADQRENRRWAILGLAACWLGMATKEVMVSAPLVVLLYDRTFVAGSTRQAWHARRGWYLGLAASWILLAVLVASTHGRGGSAGYGTSTAVGSYLLTQCAAIARYLRLAFWPSDLVFDYGTHLVSRFTEVAGAALLLALLLAATIYTLRRRPAVGFVAFCFFAWLAPSSSVVPIVTEPIAEHRMYLPLAAVVVLVVAGAAALVRNRSRSVLLACVGLGVVAGVGLGATTVRRNRDYRSEVALWTDTVRKVPGNARAHNNLAEAFRAEGETAKAVAEFAEAARVDPDYAPAQYNLGVTLLDSGHAEAAIPYLEAALTAPRHQAELHRYLGEAYERTGRPADAVVHFRAALERAPRDAEAAFGLGNNLAAQGRYADAIEPLRIAAKLAPDRVRIRNNLANALAFAGRLDEAIAEYREALRLDPHNAAVRENLEQALAAKAAR